MHLSIVSRIAALGDEVGDICNIGGGFHYLHNALSLDNEFCLALCHKFESIDLVFDRHRSFAKHQRLRSDIKAHRTVIITGANRGIGFQAAKDLAGKGHRVILTGRDLKKAQQAAQEIGENVIPMQLDVTDLNSIDQFAEAIRTETIDVLINNAGSIFENYRMAPEPSDPLQTSPDVVEKTFRLNVWGPYALTQAIFPRFAKDRRVDIINLSSGLGALNDMGPGLPAYRMSKTAINALTRLLQAELKDTNVYVNSLCPGWVRTDLGGPGATRSLEEGTVGINYLVNEEPDHRGQFIRDRSVIDW